MSGHPHGLLLQERTVDRPIGFSKSSFLAPACSKRLVRLALPRTFEVLCRFGLGYQQVFPCAFFGSLMCCYSFCDLFYRQQYDRVFAVKVEVGEMLLDVIDAFRGFGFLGL